MRDIFKKSNIYIGINNEHKSEIMVESQSKTYTIQRHLILPLADTIQRHLIFWLRITNVAQEPQIAWIYSTSLVST